MMNYAEMNWLILCIVHTDSEPFAETCMNRICKSINNQRKTEEREMGTESRETWKSTDEFSSALKAEAEAKAKLMQELNRDFDVDEDRMSWIEIALLALSVALFLWVLLGHEISF